MQALSRTKGTTNSVLQPTGRAFTLTPISPTVDSEVVDMAKRLETRFREEEAPIVVRFERLLEKIFQLEADMVESMAKNLEALGRKEAS